MFMAGVMTGSSAADSRSDIEAKVIVHRSHCLSNRILLPAYRLKSLITFCRRIGLYRNIACPKK